jgi:uncharacterized membrane protein YgdD (TMEM256/DUF423 family)
MINILFRLGCLNAGASVAIAAAGGHKPWEIDRKMTFKTATDLHMTSSIGMLISSFRSSQLALISGLLFLIGSCLFSGSAYYRCFKDNKKYNYLMPPGGSMIIMGWLFLALS